MKPIEFADAYIEGVENSVAFSSDAGPDWKQAAYNLALIVHNTRKHVKTLQAQISDMDTVVIDNRHDFLVECLSCGNDYELPCNLSEFNPNFSYCGGSERCCP